MKEDWVYDPIMLWDLDESCPRLNGGGLFKILRVFVATILEGPSFWFSEGIPTGPSRSSSFKQNFSP